MSAERPVQTCASSNGRDAHDAAPAHEHDWQAETSYAGTTIERCSCGLTRYVTHRNGKTVIVALYRPRVVDYEQYR